MTRWNASTHIVGKVYDLTQENMSLLIEEYEKFKSQLSERDSYIKTLEEQLAWYKSGDVHTCHDECKLPGCVAHREKDARIKDLEGRLADLRTPRASDLHGLRCGLCVRLCADGEDEMSEVDYSKWTFGGLLSTELHANQNQTGASGTAIALGGRNLFSAAIADHQCLGKIYLDLNKTEECAVDDYLCLLAAMETFAWAFLQEAPRYFFWRFTGIWPHAKYSAKTRVWPLGQLIWAVSVYLCSRKPFTNQDSHMQTALMVLTYERQPHRSWLCDLAVRRWKKKIKDAGYSMARIFTEYSGYPEHPLTILWGEQDKRWEFQP